MNLPECNECRAIVAEYVAANRTLAEEMRQSRLGFVEEFAQAWRQARRLRTEEDVVLAEQLFPAIQQLNSTKRVGRAFGQMLTHEARTGHKVRRLFRPD